MATASARLEAAADLVAKHHRDYHLMLRKVVGEATELLDDEEAVTLMGDRFADALGRITDACTALADLERSLRCGS